MPTVTQRRPSFARDFPRTPALDALVDAFAAGDYARVRSGAPELERFSEDADVRRAARTLASRTRPDPLVVMLLGIGVVLLAIFTVWSIGWAKPG
ncbi:MAG: hypothetical protein ACREJ3_07690 [Polyangiaceae bacterium]